MPTKSTLERVWMIFRIFVPRLGGRSFALVCANTLLIVAQTFLKGKILASLPGRLQALAIQSDRAGYISLTLEALFYRLIAAVSATAASWTATAIAVEWQASLSRHVTKKAMGDNAFYALRHVDTRIMDIETRAVADVALCATTMQSLLTSMLTPVASVSKPPTPQLDRS